LKCSMCYALTYVLYSALQTLSIFLVSFRNFSFATVRKIQKKKPKKKKHQKHDKLGKFCYFFQAQKGKKNFKYFIVQKNPFNQHISWFLQARLCIPAVHSVEARTDVRDFLTGHSVHHYWWSRLIGNLIKYC